MTETIVKGKIGSTSEWDKLYNFHGFPLVVTGCSGTHISQGYVQKGCAGCPHISRLPKQKMFADYFCLLCYMETGELKEIGRGKTHRGSDPEGEGCNGRFQLNRISPKKRRQLRGRLMTEIRLQEKEVLDFWKAKGLKVQSCRCDTCNVYEPTEKERSRTSYGYCQDAVESFGKRLDGREEFCKRHASEVCDDWREIVPIDRFAGFYETLNQMKVEKVEKLVRVLAKARLLEAGKEALRVS